jgi:allantoicase
MARWSVGLEAEGDRVMSHDEILALADAVAADGGIATGIGTPHYGAQLVVMAPSRNEAVSKARTSFTAAAREANLPDWPVVRIEATSEEEDLLDE